MYQKKEEVRFGLPPFVLERVAGGLRRCRKVRKAGAEGSGGGGKDGYKAGGVSITSRRGIITKSRSCMRGWGICRSGSETVMSS